MNRLGREFIMTIAAALAGAIVCGMAAGAGKVDLSQLPPAVKRKVDFERDVRPIFQKTCYSCHGPEKQKSDYRLDVKATALKGGSIGGAVVPGDSARSAMIAYVAGAHDEIRMPPKGQMLSAEQVGLLRAWIDQGARWPETAVASSQASHWSLRPLVKPPTPASKKDGWVRTPVDAFVLSALERNGLRPSPEADRRTLIRRVTFDLTGLPPTPAEVETFENDRSPDAYEKVVDRLLASPRYGERWARHWMDVVHYAETHGHDEDIPRPNAWPYRDYLIRSFNADKPYARFVEEQLAGDTLWPDDPDAFVATAFNAVGPWDESSQMGIMDGTLDKQAARYLDRDDMLSTAMSTFVSSTVHCARCHNHKFDPIPQADYYALQAVFAGVDRIDRPYDDDPKIHAQRRELSVRRAALAADKVPAEELLAPEAQSKVAQWQRARAALDASWKTVDVVEAFSNYGATLTKLQDGSVLSAGERPDKDAYTITARSPLPRVTAVRLELLTDPSLPKSGPGRADNGNLHLSDLTVTKLRADGTGQRLQVKSATADFDQDGFPIAGALDNKPETSWAIHPNEGKPHHAVFELKDPVELKEGERLAFLLEQRQGSGHLIGRARLSVTDHAPPIRALKLPDPISPTQLARLVLLEEVDRALAALPPQQQVYTIACDFEPRGNFKPARKPRPVDVLRRGDIRQPIEPASPGALSCVAGLESRFNLAQPDDEGTRRAALARWITARENVLTWRSIVNRVWHYHFGRGICETPNDFGRMGAAPSHPELLDYLAVTFRDDLGGSLKRLHRLIVTSNVYRQSSAHDPACATIDGENHFLWRANRTRLDAEAVRDAILCISGKLDTTMYGPSAKQFVQSQGVHQTPIADYAAFDVDSAGSYRRSVYRFVFRTVPDPFMQALDCPDASQWAPKRETSVTALQALAMLNDRFVIRQSQHIATRLADAGDLKAQVHRFYRLALSRPPTSDEAAAVETYATKHGLPNAVRMLLNSNEFMFVE